jgi:hypothetical protein
LRSIDQFINPSLHFNLIMFCDTIECDPLKVIIVDWDDTILPSTFVDRLQIENSRDLPLHVSLIQCEVFFKLSSSKSSRMNLAKR